MSELSKQYHSLIISGRNTWDYWHLLPTTRPVVNPPEVEENYVKIAGQDGFVDLTELLADRPIFGKRTGSWEFIAHPDYAIAEPWEIKYSSIMSYLHGQFHNVILEDDPNYFYSGRLKVNNWKSDKDWSLVTIDYVLQPYKRELEDVGSEPWKWDPFNFETGVIDNAYLVPISGTKTIILAGGNEPVSPLIEASIADGNSLTLTFKGATYTLQHGINHINGLVLSPGENTFIFSGNGSVSINYRRGWL